MLQECSLRVEIGSQIEDCGGYIFIDPDRSTLHLSLYSPSPAPLHPRMLTTRTGTPAASFSWWLPALLGQCRSWAGNEGEAESKIEAFLHQAHSLLGRLTRLCPSIGSWSDCPKVLITQLSAQLLITLSQPLLPCDYFWSTLLSLVVFV